MRTPGSPGSRPGSRPGSVAVPLTARLVPTAALAAVAALGCQDTIVKVLGPENDVIVTVQPDSFRFEAHDLDNVHDDMSWTWTNNGTKAVVHHRSFVHHGVGRITILDALGDSVYRVIPFEYNLDNETDLGVRGPWTIHLELFGARGRIDFSVAKAP